MKEEEEQRDEINKEMRDRLLTKKSLRNDDYLQNQNV